MYGLCAGLTAEDVEQFDLQQVFDIADRALTQIVRRYDAREQVAHYWLCRVYYPKINTDGTDLS